MVPTFVYEDSRGFHSPLMAPVVEPLVRAASGVRFRMPAVPLVSDLTGRFFDDAERFDAEYLGRHVRHGVNFQRAIEVLGKWDAFVEIGTVPVLKTFGESVLGGGKRWFGPDRSNRTALENALSSLAGLFTAGADVKWDALHPEKLRRVSIPTYTFDRRRYWIDRPAGTTDVASAGLNSSDHPLLGARIALADSERRLLTARLSVAAHPWLADHQVFGTTLFPGTGFLELAWAAGQAHGRASVDSLSLVAPPGGGAPRASTG
jgi:acyl transferase domain-containing protein